MSVLAPPEPPPQVERPDDQGSEPSATRVSRYRTWTRLKQASQLGTSLAALTVATAISVAGGQPPWEPAAGKLVAYALVLTVACAMIDPIVDGRRLRRRVAAAEPLPDGAREIDARPLEALLGPPFLLTGATLGAVFGLAGLLFGDETTRIVVGVLAGLGAGRIIGYEILLRALVERADPERLFFVSLDEDDESQSALLWRAKRP
jgi:hypothetical protein